MRTIDAAAPSADGAMPPLLSLRGIRKAYGAATVLDGIDLDFRRGEVVGLLGENGAGKSTLMNIVSGSVAADDGSVIFDGRQRNWSHPRQAMEAGIAFVHQELTSIGAMTVRENLFLGDYCARRAFIDIRAMREGARRLLDQVGAAHIDPDAEMSTLRIADQQSVEIAKALRSDLKVLLLDEPTSSLTAHEAQALFKLVETLKTRGVSIVFITHKLEETLAVCDRVIVLRDGRLISHRAIADTNRSTMVAEMAGREIRLDVARRADVPAGRDVRLRVQNLSAAGLLRGVDLDVRAGEVLGLFGLVGAGRTELLETLFGARAIDAGTLELDGQPYTPRSPVRALAHGVTLLPEGRKANGILPSQSVAQNITASVLKPSSRFGFLDRRALRRHLDAGLTQCRVQTHDVGQAIEELSGGNQQKALLARCLAVGPRVLLLDEPTHGIDVGAKEQVYHLIEQLAAQGVAVLFASSDVLEIMRLANGVVVLSNGRVAERFSASEFDPVRIVGAAFRYLEQARG
ncbi:sugar ABC transporter ATP-binding protein [Pararobbsia silviterrae]|nr:sugar ABC transporter ATP-binding protein [Pararobbsia silviterrae]